MDPTRSADVRLEDPPLDPDSPQARDWLARELEKGVYSDRRSVVERILDRLQDLLSSRSGPGGGLPPWATLLVVGLVVLALLVLIVLVLRRDRRVGRDDEQGAVLEEVGVGAQEYRRRARAHLSAGRNDEATLDAYRAIAVGADERTLLDGAPGRTADEIARLLGPVFPDHRDALETAARSFDRVRYGREHVGPDVAGSVLDLDARLSRTRPELPRETP